MSEELKNENGFGSSLELLDALGIGPVWVRRELAVEEAVAQEAPVVEAPARPAVQPAEPVASPVAEAAPAGGSDLEDAFAAAPATPVALPVARPAPAAPRAQPAAPRAPERRSPPVADYRGPPTWVDQ